MSGRISIDNLSDSLKEMIANSGMTEEQIIELLENEEVIDSLKTDSKSIVGAINELFQSANNGKELIANAIGEPLNAEDTFSAMSGSINGLLSTFKTNMMNNGVTVESGDKFKALIDKIATLADNEGKGIQISTGHFDITTLQPASEGMGVLTSNQLNFNPPLNFTPDRVILSIPKLQLGTSVGGDYANHSIDSEIHSSLNNRFTVYDENGKEINMYIGTVINDITAEGFVLNAGKNNTNYALTTPEGIDWLAIGVGEEDTTLRDSLASILEEEGVSVTEEDDMASLISKVDEEFDRKNNETNLPGIHCVSSLPEQVEDGQIIIIAESYNNIYVDNKKINEIPLTEGDIYIKYGLESPYTENINNPDNPIAIHLEVVYQMIGGNITFIDEIYKGVDGEWVKILDTRVYYFNEGVFKVSSSKFYVNNMQQYNMGLITSGDFNNYFKLDVQFSNGNSNGILAYGSDYKIDLTQFSKIKMTYTQKCTSTSNYAYDLVNNYTPGYFGLFTASEREVFYVGDSRMTCSEFVGQIKTNYDKEFTIEMDVTNIDGEHYFGVGIATQGTTHINYSGMYIKSIEFIK